MRPYTKREAIWAADTWHWLEDRDGDFCDVRPVLVTKRAPCIERITEAVEPPDRWKLWMSSMENGDIVRNNIERDMMNYGTAWRLWPSQPSVEESLAIPWVKED